MIPRTKVNYGLTDLLRAVWVREVGKDYRSYLTHLLQEYLNESHILLMPSGRAGLYYILRAIAAPRVLIPAYTCKAVAEAAKLAGKEVICVPIEDNSFNLSLTALEPLLDENSIVIATHQFGFPCNIKALISLCRSKKAFVIEDVAAALGTRIEGQLVGTFADAAFYSFDSTKLINVPLKAGFITVKDFSLFEVIRHIYQAEIEVMPRSHTLNLLVKAAILVLLENHWLYQLFHTLFFEWRGKFTEDSEIMNLQKTEFYRYEVMNWQAFIATIQVVNLDHLIKVRQSIYAQYIDRLKTCRAFELPPADINQEWACIRFPIRIRDDKISYYKQAIKRGLDFAFSFTFIPCTNCSKAQALANSVLDLPYYTKLSDREMKQVISTLHTLEKIEDEI